MANRYWVLDTGTWDNSTTTHWSTSSGGLGGASVPGTSDDVIFDANSCLLNGTVTPNYNFSVRTVTMGAFTGTLDFSANNNSPTFLASSTTNFNLSGTGVRTLKLGSGTFRFSGYTTPWNATVTTNLTFDAGTSLLFFQNTYSQPIPFQGGDLTYHNVQFGDPYPLVGNITIYGNNTFADLYIILVSRTLKFSNGSTTHVTTFRVRTDTSLTVLSSDTTETFNLIKDGGGTINCDYLDISHCVASPANTWYAGANCVNHQSLATAGSGWIFYAPNFPNLRRRFIRH
jgi:hypothetical protein